MTNDDAVSEPSRCNKSGVCSTVEFTLSKEGFKFAIRLSVRITTCDLLHQFTYQVEFLYGLDLK
jgi:hypothetical protein